MLSVALNPDIERRLSELARRTGRSESDFARELIEGNIDDLEDRYLAEKPKKPAARVSPANKCAQNLGWSI
jgi:RHH-type transcriptional regulator, rel operon repressor / antitoxin RelB